MTCKIHEVQGFYQIIQLHNFRATEGVAFDLIPKSFFKGVGSIDRVIHKAGAISPGAVGDVDRPWYMHPFQEDKLIVLHGVRNIELYSPLNNLLENFVVTPDKIMMNGETIVEGGGVLTWSPNIFHRVRSGEAGSACMNLATHFDGFDIRTNFNIYDLDTNTGVYQVIREGHLDQSEPPCDYE
jgi:hypothetical protein